MVGGNTKLSRYFLRPVWEGQSTRVWFPGAEPDGTTDLIRHRPRVRDSWGKSAFRPPSHLWCRSGRRCCWRTGAGWRDGPGCGATRETDSGFLGCLGLLGAVEKAEESARQCLSVFDDRVPRPVSAIAVQRRRTCASIDGWGVGESDSMSEFSRSKASTRKRQKRPSEVFRRGRGKKKKGLKRAAVNGSGSSP